MDYGQELATEAGMGCRVTLQGKLGCETLVSNKLQSVIMGSVMWVKNQWVFSMQ